MPWWIVISPGLAMPSILLVVVLVTLCGTTMAIINQAVRRWGREIMGVWRRRSLISINWTSFR
jgi:hypothetical protein